jgi:hypothetical protein
MKSQTLGINTSEIEILNIDKFGFWIFIKGKEYFLPYKEYPWFENAKLKDILNVKLLHDTHIYWPSLDIDLDIKIINDPDKYPLTYQ